MEFEKVGTQQLTLMIIGLCLFLIVPLIIAIIWKLVKKERFSTILVGAVTFLLFALILEKPIQNVLVFPTQMGLPDHAAARFINARPILWAFLVGLFPGVFEETGRLIAFKTVLGKRKNRETSVSYGIGHGGFEVMLILGLTYISNISYAFMINSGAFEAVVEQAKALAPEQADQAYAVAAQLATFSLSDLGIGVFERIFAFLFHVGASILVFYACKERKKFWLYPLAILLHTLTDMTAALYMKEALPLSQWGLNIFVAVFGALTFFGAYFLLYRKDTVDPEDPS
ncbi:MAG: YhfC family intramembrane metalloprotease [Lachnospiraceae bacterium]|nr:YhfC family intramembrane metalloprotease [Lachnospiraceae bacterium]